jgi:hypothetical protein
LLFRTMMTVSVKSCPLLLVFTSSSTLTICGWLHKDPICNVHIICS